MWVKFNVQQQLMVCSLLCTRPPFKITRIIHVLFLSTTKLKLVLLNQRNKFEFLQNTIGPKFLQKVTCSTKGSLTEKFNREISIRIPIRNWPKFLYNTKRIPIYRLGSFLQEFLLQLGPNPYRKCNILYRKSNKIFGKGHALLTRQRGALLRYLFTINLTLPFDILPNIYRLGHQGQHSLNCSEAIDKLATKEPHP